MSTNCFRTAIRFLAAVLFSASIAAPALAQDYFPLKKGHKWVYQVTDQAPKAKVEGERVRRAADPIGGGHPHSVEVNQQQPRVAVAGDKGQPVGSVDQQAVVVVAAGQPDAAHDLLAARVDDRELVAALHRDQHLGAGRAV